MKAIQTQYKGYRFRSRLEARWAVFFDALGLRWEYEPEGFDLGNGERYLPDFFVRLADPIRRAKGYGYWVEIKGKAPTFEEIRKFEALCRGTQHNGYIFSGTPGENERFTFDFRLPYSHRSRTDGIAESAVVWMCADDPYNSGGVQRAIVASRSARFEFGESGAAQ